MKRVGLALCLIGIASVVLAAEVAGVRLDDRASVAGKDLVLNGAGIRTRAFFKVYVASLYVPGKTRDATAVLSADPRRVQIDLLRTLSADTLSEAFLDGMKDNNTEAELAGLKREIDQLMVILGALKEVKERDRVTLDFGDGATRIGLNGEVRGSIPGEPFNRALMKIWFGNRPVQADLRKAMLGG